MARDLPGKKDGRRAPATRGGAPEGMVPNHKRSSRDLIYEAVMRGGGEPFGAPYAVGTPTLTERIVRKFKQRSFFSFETFERSNNSKRLNKYTRYGASPFRGDYRRKP